MMDTPGPVDTLVDEVTACLEGCDDARFKSLMTGLVHALHDYVRRVDLTPDEWMQAIEFLTATGRISTDKRQEFILLSDTLGISMLVVALAQQRASRAANNRVAPTEATVQGPYYWQGAPPPVR